MQRVLRISLALTFAYILLTLFAGLRAHSLALISEAGHNASDFLALLLSFIAVYLQSRPANDSKTYGYQRAGVLAAFVNALTLIVIAGWIAVEALERLAKPVPVESRIMMIVAVAGVCMNGILAAMLVRVSRDVNMRSAFIHMLGDTLSTAAVIVGGAVIYFTGREWVDPVLSLLIAVLIFWSSLAIVRETLNILLEGTPRGVSLSVVRGAMQGVTGVCGVHDLHVWSLGSNLHALSCHVTIPDLPLSESGRILEDLNRELKSQFRILHTTIQFENLEGGECAVAQGCLQAEEELEHHHGHAH
jgi:cobalt-zinc-cadmium efflux system protein